MPTVRSFSFPISTLLRAAGRLSDALGDETVGPAVVQRLPEDFAADFAAQITLVAGEGNSQSTAIGTYGQLTQAQLAALRDMRDLASGARQTSQLFMPKGDTRLRSEFQVGIKEPQTLAAELERAGKIHTACGTYASEMTKKGWLATDTTALGTAITALGAVDDVQEAAGDHKQEITGTRLVDANLLFKMCRTAQNAANLSFPARQAGTTPGVIEARARYLLDEFPPRDNSEDEEETPPTDPPVTP